MESNSNESLACNEEAIKDKTKTARTEQKLHNITEIELKC